MPNQYTGTDNDPFSQAQHLYAGKDWERFFQSLQGKRVSMGGFGRAGAPSLAEMGRPGDEDTARTVSTNLALGNLLDARGPRDQSLRAMTAHNDMNDRAMRDQQEIDRAMAIANTPGVSQNGRPIEQTPGVRGDYTTVTPDPNQPQPPVNRQALAAQMAPGQIAPPAPAPPVTYGKPEAAMVDGKRIFVRAGSDGLTYDTARRPIDPASLQPEDAAGAGNTNVADVVAGMMGGTLPPQLPGRASKDYIAIQAEAKRQGYDLAGAVTDWTATQKHVQTMNGAQQLRLNQAINSLPDMLDSVDSLATKWAGGKFPMLNKASLALAKGGAYGPDAASIANQLDAQIADVTADLGNVYMGGNSPTDHALSLAGKSLKGEWDEKVLHDMVALAKKNVQIRRNSIANTGVAGASADNPYGNQGAAAASPAGPAGGTVELIAPDGGILDVPAGDVAGLMKAHPNLKRKGGG